MNAVEIEEAVSELASQPFDSSEFPYQFLAAFGAKPTTLKRLKTGQTNRSDVPGGVLQSREIHLAVCDEDQISQTLEALRASPKTASAKVKFILATDGKWLKAEDLANGEPLETSYAEFADHFGFFLPLAGISTVHEIKNNPVDIKATGRFNKLYVELLKNNPEWTKAERRHDMNHFMAQLIFCFFAEDTGIFGKDEFSHTVEEMSQPDASDTHEVIATIFHAMNANDEERNKTAYPRWASKFPYVNGKLFAGVSAIPKFSKIARAYLIRAGELDWKQINPDIFGSMIQAIADEKERSALGTHYTSVPNILKVLNPLFLDDLRTQLEAAGGNERKLLNLRKRMSKIRVFDPACGSGNFLVIAYKEMRKIEAEINKRRGEIGRATEIPLTNFRGIEINDFPVEIARLSLVVAEYQCDSLYRGELLANAEFLPLKNENWITCGNALHLDWLKICPPTGSEAKVVADDLFEKPFDQTEIDFENEGGETYICGNPPYIGSTWQSAEQKNDMQGVFATRVKKWKSLDYVSAWFMKAADYGTKTQSSAAFVSTNSICQGRQVAILWKPIFQTGCEIAFAYTSFKWANLAAYNAGVTVVIVGISNHCPKMRYLFSNEDNGTLLTKKTENINAYLFASKNIIVEEASRPINGLHEMNYGNKAVDGGNLTVSTGELQNLNLTNEQNAKFIRRYFGSEEFIHGKLRYCIWIDDEKKYKEAEKIPSLNQRIESTREMRLASRDKSANDLASRPYQMREMYKGRINTIVIPRHSSEGRPFLPVGFLEKDSIIGDSNFALYDAPLWNLAIIASRLHLVWIATVCGKLETRYRYSNTLGWNTFPIPPLTEQNKADLTRCAEAILLARETHFPATIADLYKADAMPDNLRHAHELNDETLERIYIGRRFKNDTERLEKLFEMYSELIENKAS